MKRNIKLIVVACLLWSGLGAQSVNVETELRKLEGRGLPYFYNDEIEQTAKAWLRNDNGSTSIVMGRYRYYNVHIDKIRRSMDLPWFVAVIPAANTGFEPRFRDENGYAGQWPLSYLMGKKYGLKLTALNDERRDPQASALAACKYIKDLYTIYNDWLMVITAFKIGPARLNQVIHLVGTLDFATVYEALEPQERIPVIQFYSAAVAMNYAQEGGSIEPTLHQVISSDTVTSIDQVVPFAVLRDHLGVEIDDLRNLNPSLQADYIPFTGNLQTFRLPVRVVSIYRKKRDSVGIWLDIRKSSPVKYDTLTEVVDDDTITIIRTANDGISVENTIIPKTNTEQKVWVYYKIKRGDGLFTLTDIFDCTAQQVRSWNGVKGNSIVVGKTLKFYVPLEKRQFYKRLNSIGLVEKRAIADQD